MNVIVNINGKLLYFVGMYIKLWEWLNVIYKLWCVIYIMIVKYSFKVN